MYDYMYGWLQVVVDIFIRDKNAAEAFSSRRMSILMQLY